MDIRDILIIVGYTSTVVLLFLVIRDWRQRDKQKQELKELVVLMDLIKQKERSLDDYEEWEPEYKALDAEVGDLNDYVQGQIESLSSQLQIDVT